MIKLSRNKNKIKVDFKSGDIYKYYVKNNKHDADIVDKTTFNSILKAFFLDKFNQIIYKNETFSMPARLGDLRIRKRKTRLKLDSDGNLDKSKLKIDYRKTLDLWSKLYPGKSMEEIKQIPDRKVIYHMNDHTDGDIVHFYWDKITSNVKNQSAYRYMATRTLKRNLAKTVKTLNIQYYG